MSKVYPKKCNVYQEQFHRHFNSEGHNGMEDWKITITDRTKNVLESRRRERERERERERLGYWQHSVDRFIPNELNGHFVGIPYVIICFTFLQQILIAFAT